MNRFQQGLRLALFLAAACLLVNDVVRLALPYLQETLSVSLAFEQECEEENIPMSGSNMLEEEAKQQVPFFWLEPVINLNDDNRFQNDHLIEDDDISVLAFITIFSPPPERA